MQKESQVVEIRPDDIVLEEEIGRGSFAQVYRGKCRGQTVAIKVLHTQTYTEQVLQAFREEIAVMSQIHHPNLVLFMGACTIPGKLMIVTELMPRNLESVFLGKAGKHKRVTLVQKIKMAKDAALGMNWLHKSTPMFIHRDFKLSNLLVDENYNVKVCDFGLTKMKQANDNLHDDSKGSPLYMAPEVFTGSYSEKCDVYSFGLSFWEIINERRVFPRYENNLQALIKSRCENYETPPITDDMLPRLVSLLKRCWDKNPRLRPSFDVVVKELEEIIIEQCITDERGREVWKKASKGEDKMTWDDLARAVCISVGKVALAESYRSDRQMQCLKVLLCRQSEPNTVHAEKFGKVLAWFGPFFDGRGGDAQSRGRTFLDRIEETLSMKWFHGELSTQDAEERLDNRRPGTFLVRFSSSEKGAFTVSGVDRDRKKSHQRLIYHPNKGLYVMPDETIYTSLIDAINDLCRASKLRHPCPGSRYAKYFSEEPQPTSKNIALVKEEIKQLQLIHLNEICEVPDKDISLDTTIDTASIAGRPWGGHHQLSHHHQFASGPLGGTRSPFHTGNMSIHSSGTWGGGGGGGGSGVIGGDSDSDAIRIAPYIPPLNSGGGGGSGGGSGLTSPYNTGGLGGHHSSGPSSSSAIPASVQAALAANKAATSAATAAAYRQSPYTHASKYPNLTYSPHPLNSAELYYSAPMPGMKSTSSSSFSFSQFASTKHPFRSKDVLTAPLKSEEKKRGLFSRLKRGVTGGKDKDKDHHRDGDRDDGSDLSDSSVSSTWSGKSGGKMLSGKGGGGNNSGGGGGGKKSGKKGKKDKKDSSLNRKGHTSKEDKDFGFHGEDHGYHRGSGGGGGGGDNGGGTSDDDSLGMYGMSPYVVPSVTADSTTASTNSIPAHVLCTLQKAEDERIRKRINGNYDSDSSTEDLFPPYQPSSSTSSSSSYIKRAAEEKSRHLHHLVGGKEMQEQEEQQEEDDDRDDDDEEEDDEENESSDDEDESSGEEEEDSDDEEEEEKAKAKKQKKGKRKEEEEKKQKKSKAKESSRAHKEDKERRREKKHHHHSTKSSSSERRKEEREASISTSPSGKEAKRRTKQPHIPITFVARPGSGSAAPAPMSLAATAPPGFMEAALLSAPRARRERKPERSVRKVTTNDYGNGNGRAKADGGEEEGLRLDQVVSPPAMKTSTSPTSTLTVGGLDGNSHREHRKKKKSRGSKGDGGSPASTGDEAETMTATSSSSSSSMTKKEKKSKKDKSGKGVKEALQRRQQRAPTSASSDLTTGGEEDETSEKEQNDPQGKKKKKDEERTVIAVF